MEKCEYAKTCKSFLEVKCKPGDFNVCGRYPEQLDETGEVEKADNGLTDKCECGANVVNFERIKDTACECYKGGYEDGYNNGKSEYKTSLLDRAE
jgi:hypothetical protein